MGKGDFTQIAETRRKSGAALVEKLGTIKGLNLLDLGCGDGTTAIPAATAGKISCFGSIPLLFI